MLINIDIYHSLLNLKNAINEDVKLIAVSKLQSVEAIKELYNLGHRDFGENYVQELVNKVEILPKDINWHFIGHLQSNKVKYIAPFVHLIQGVDSFKLLSEINKQAKKQNRIIDCLLQVHIANEETKFGFSFDEVEQLFSQNQLLELKNICIKGVMGMASFVDDKNQVEQEFENLHQVFSLLQSNLSNNCSPIIASFGMSGDFELAIKCNSNMIRVGSMLFGARKV